MTPKNSLHGPNRAALEATIGAAPVLAEDEHAATVQLARTLADLVDTAGTEVSSRLSAAYLSALKDVGRAVKAAKPVPRRSSLAAVPDDGDLRPSSVTRAARSRSWRTTT